MDQTLRPGEIFAGYRVVEEIGSGGHGVVYRARNREYKPAFVALKVLNEAASKDPELRRRFTREAKILADLNHPNIVRIFDSGDEGGRLWIAMEYIVGSDATKALKTTAAIPPNEAARIITAIGSALDHAHDIMVLHRDVKPSNILLESVRPYRTMLSDFGIARNMASETTATIGTVATFQYIAPERLDPGANVDQRADVYSLGCTLYHLLTGHPPFPGGDAVQLGLAHLNASIPIPTSANPSLPKAFDDVIVNALAKSPHARYESCGALARAANRAARPKRVDPYLAHQLLKSNVQAWEVQSALDVGRIEYLERNLHREIRKIRQAALIFAGALIIGGIDLFTWGLWPAGELRSVPPVAVAVTAGIMFLTSLNEAFEATPSARRMSRELKGLRERDYGP
ncbi:serine/threonine-protein kinase [Nocardia sp. NPDC059240]|uniref:serine/threonine-protein kinase n=1 Tax=Nocardia sp. NPDC059240 TaxID=3346786 RepID=UPI0036C8E0F9